VAIDRSGEFWRGTDPADLAFCIRDFAEGNYPVGPVTPVVCAGCGKDEFAVLLDPDEGFVRRTCTACRSSVLMLDSADAQPDAQPDTATCPCGGETFNAAVGYALLGDGEVRWVYVGLRCITDGTMGVYAEWKIDYAPSTQLLSSA
jgi:hypothetical protein